MKKMLIVVLSVLLLMAFACAEDVVLPTFAWEHDGLNHWQLDASGAVVNLGAHDTGNGWLCIVCGSEILDWGDGCYDVTDYDAYGNVVRYSSYDAEGNLTGEIINVLTLNEDGLPLKVLEYFNGVLCGEYIYTVNEAGDWLPVSYTAWNDDGTTSVNQYDEHGNCVYAAVYEANGALIHETISEYAPIEDEWFGLWFYECKTTSRFASGETFYDEHNEYGDPVCSRNTYADGTVWSDTTYEYEYQDGTKVWSRQYSFGVLTLEEHFDDDGNLVKETEYLESGSTVVSLYNENGDLTATTSYAADGSVITSTTVEYLYDVDLNLLETHLYTDGQPATSIIYLYDEDMNSTGREEKFPWEGGTIVDAYNTDGNLISTTVYDADGNVIETGTYEYVYNDDMTLVAFRTYINGVLAAEIIDLYDEDMVYIGYQEITYHEDGTRTVKEYDDWFELVRTIVYDADGNVISDEAAGEAAAG